MNQAVFLDRDGVINDLIERDGGFYSPQHVHDFNLVSGVKYFIRQLKSMDYIVIIVSNQPDVARRLMAEKDLRQMTEIIMRTLQIDDVLYCIHDDPDKHGCRKPMPGLIFKARDKWNIDLNKSLMIGDTWKDVLAAKNAGVQMYLLDKVYNKEVICDNRIVHLNQIIEKLKLIKE